MWGYYSTVVWSGGGGGRALPGEGITLTLALSPQGRGDRTAPPAPRRGMDSGSGAGMTEGEGTGLGGKLTYWVGVEKILVMVLDWDKSAGGWREVQGELREQERGPAG